MHFIKGIIEVLLTIGVLLSDLSPQSLRLVLPQSSSKQLVLPNLRQNRLFRSKVLPDPTKLRISFPAQPTS